MRNYGSATVFRAAGWARVSEFALPPQEQGESVAAPASSNVVWVGTEGNRSPVQEVALPDLPGQSGPATSTRPPATDQTAPAQGAHQSPSGGEEQGADESELDTSRELATWIGGGALAALLVVLGLLVVRSRRSRHH